MTSCSHEHLGHTVSTASCHSLRCPLQTQGTSVDAIPHKAPSLRFSGDDNTSHNTTTTTETNYRAPTSCDGKKTIQRSTKPHLYRSTNAYKSVDLDNPEHHEPREARQIRSAKRWSHHSAACTFSFRSLLCCTFLLSVSKTVSKLSKHASLL